MAISSKSAFILSASAVQNSTAAVTTCTMFLLCVLTQFLISHLDGFSVTSEFRCQIFNRSCFVGLSSDHDSGCVHDAFGYTARASHFIGTRWTSWSWIRSFAGLENILRNEFRNLTAFKWIFAWWWSLQACNIFVNFHEKKFEIKNYIQAVVVQPMPVETTILVEL